MTLSLEVSCSIQLSYRGIKRIVPEYNLWSYRSSVWRRKVQVSDSPDVLTRHADLAIQNGRIRV